MWKQRVGVAVTMGTDPERRKMEFTIGSKATMRIGADLDPGSASDDDEHSQLSQTRED